MVSFRRIALLLVFALPALLAAQAQTSSSSDSAAQATGTTQAAQPQPTVNIEARIKARRAQRRIAAIHEAYGHLYDAFAGMGYQRFILPSPLQRVNEYSWDAGFTRYRNERLGYELDTRGTYGTAYVYNNPTNIWKPAISQYGFLVGPTYRFYMQPKYSISGRLLGGLVHGNFSGDTANNNTTSTSLNLYPTGYTYGLNAAVVGEYNISPEMSLRVAPEYFATGFGSSYQNNLGFTIGLGYRWGKQ